MSKGPTVGVNRAAQDAAAARREIIEAGGIVPLWKLPRHLIKPGEAVFETPEQLWDAACEYFLWSENNPIEYMDNVRVGGAVQAVRMEKPRPLHLRAFKKLVGISERMWTRMLNLPEFEQVIEDIENVIYLQKFDHGMIGVYDSGMTSKDLGLTDKRELQGNISNEPPPGSPKDILLNRLIREENEE